jgi:Fur family ferric uptake transcriptional regulator
MRKKVMSTNCKQFATIKNTKPRLAVHKVLSAADNPLSAKDIFAKLNGIQGVWLSSVYRTLAVFEKNNLVSKSTLPNGEAIYELTNGEHSHYAICTKCKSKTKIPFCPMADCKLNGFNPTSHKLEIYGLCKKCRQAAKRF